MNIRANLYEILSLPHTGKLECALMISWQARSTKSPVCEENFRVFVTRIRWAKYQTCLIFSFRNHKKFSCTERKVHTVGIRVIDKMWRIKVGNFKGFSELCGIFPDPRHQISYIKMNSQTPFTYIRKFHYFVCNWQWTAHYKETNISSSWEIAFVLLLCQ